MPGVLILDANFIPSRVDDAQQLLQLFALRVDDAHESLRLGVFDRLFRRVVDGDDFIYAPVFVRDRGDARAGVGGDRRRRLGRSG